MMLNSPVIDNAPRTIANRLANPTANDCWEESIILVYLMLCPVWEGEPVGTMINQYSPPDFRVLVLPDCFFP